jgi:hypothetical protein
MEAFVSAHKPEMIQAFAKALGVVVHGIALAVKAGATLASAYGKVRVMFAQVLEYGLKPLLFGLTNFVKTINFLADKIPGLNNPLKGAVETLESLSAGLHANTEDQKRFAEGITSSAKQVSEWADAFDVKLQQALRSVISKQEELRASNKPLADSYDHLNKTIEQTSGALTVLPKKAAPEAKQALAEVAVQATETAKQIFVVADAARSVGTAAEEGVGKAVTQFGALSQAVAQTIGGMPGAFDVKDGGKGINKLMDIITKFKTAGGFASSFAQSALDAMRSGDLLALKEIAATLQKQASIFLTTSTFAPQVRLGNMELAGRLSGLGGILSSLIADLSNAPKRAFGGSAYRGQPVIVGERGPELFTPSQSGTVRSNSSLLQGNAETVSILTRIARLLEGGRSVSLNIDGREITSVVERNKAHNMMRPGWET